jgi:hypothetical protein
MDILLIIFLFASGFFAGYQHGRRKRVGELETRVERLESL